MPDAAQAFSLPEDWRDAARDVASREAVSEESLLRELAALPAGGPFDFAEGWGRLVAALAEALDAHADAPALAASFLRHEWSKISRLAEVMDGEPPPPEVEASFHRAVEFATTTRAVRGVVSALRWAAEEIRSRGDLSPLQELRWEAEPEPPAVEPPDLAVAAPEPQVEEPPASPPAPLGPVSPAPAASPLESTEPRSFHEHFSLLLLAGPALRRQYLERQLVAAGFSVETADNTGEAVQRLSSGRYDAVLVEPALEFADLKSWAEHAGASRILRLQQGGAFGGAVREQEIFLTPPSEEEIERLRQSL